MITSRSLTIGSRPDCDLVVNVPSVSGSHCRLTRTETGYLLEDLNSTNGTFFNGQRVRGAVPVTLGPGDAIHLGSHALPIEALLALFQPAPASTISFRTAELVIGRVAGCDHVIEQPMISSRHARLYRDGTQIFIEDLRSANGTFVNGVRLTGPMALSPTDQIALGSHVVALNADSWLPASSPPAKSHDTAATRPAEPLVQALEPLSTLAAGTGPGEVARLLNRPWLRLAALLALAPVTALLIAALAAGTSTAPVLFWLGLCAVGFGLANAVFGGLVKPAHGPAGLPPEEPMHPPTQLLTLAALSALQCLLAWSIVAPLAALRAPSLSALAVLLLAAAVGLALGLLVVDLAPRPSVARAIVPALLLVMWLFGGEWKPLHQMPGGAGLAAGLMPSRWAFEGLLLLEAEQEPVLSSPGGGSSPANDRDRAEVYFPAEVHRMGLRADVMALGAMVIGLAATVAFIGTSPKAR